MRRAHGREIQELKSTPQLKGLEVGEGSKGSHSLQRKLRLPFGNKGLVRSQGLREPMPSVFEGHGLQRETNHSRHGTLLWKPKHNEED